LSIYQDRTIEDIGTNGKKRRFRENCKKTTHSFAENDQ
jgi:hypothetical protein